MKQLITFKKKRELGEILSDTFKFLRLNGKELFGYILKIAGPALLIMVVALIVYMQSFNSLFGISSGAFGEGILSGGTTIISILVLFFAAMAFYALLYGTINHYINSYIKNDGIVSKEEVHEGMRKSFWPLIGLSFLASLMTGVGFVFCGFPGIYFGVVLATCFSVYVMEKRTVTESISVCFDLIKGEWWITFATLFITFLLYYVIVIVFSIPQYIYFFIRGIASAETISSDPSAMFDWVSTALNAIALIAQYLALSLVAITTVFIYFNLNERKNFTGTIETIENLGAEKE